jgi:dienelactone hydrolase
MTEAEADWQLHSYGNTYHAFTNQEANDPNLGTQYNENADRRSWQSMMNFFAEIF